MPGYLQYVTDSVSLRTLDLPEPDPGSTVSLKVVKPDSSLISYLEGLDPDIETEVLVLTYKSGQIERMRSLIFDRELNLLFDTRSLDSNFGRLTDWIFPPYSYDYPILGLGNLDLGQNSIRVQKDGGISDFFDSGRWDDRQRFVTMFDSAVSGYKDYAVEIEVLDPPNHDHVTGAFTELRLSLRYSRDVLGARLPDGTGLDTNLFYDSLANDSVPPNPGDGDARTSHLLTEPLNAILAEVHDEGLIDLLQFNEFGDPIVDYIDVFIAEIIEDRDNNRMVLVLSVLDRDIHLMYMMFFLPFGDLANETIYPNLVADTLPDKPYYYDIGINIENSYEYLVIPAVHRLRRELLHFDWDGEYFRVFNASDSKNLDELWRDMNIDIYRLSGPGITPVSTNTPALSLEAKIPYRLLYQQMEYGYDFGLTFSDAEGRWYMYDREAHGIYQLGLGAGGWK
jgi:hypothetical protein